MIKFFTNKSAWKESVIDTSIGFVMNFPLNIIVLYICAALSLSVITTSIVLSATFTIIAVLRKYIVRVYFNKPS